MIEGISKRDRVIKLWTGFRHYIQQALWKDGLHLEVSDWDEVVAQAEMIEIAQNVSSNFLAPSDHRRSGNGNGKPKVQLSNGANTDTKFRGFWEQEGMTSERKNLAHLG